MFTKLTLLYTLALAGLATLIAASPVPVPVPVPVAVSGPGSGGNAYSSPQLSASDSLVVREPTPGLFGTGLDLLWGAPPEALSHAPTVMYPPDSLVPRDRKYSRIPILGSLPNGFPGLKLQSLPSSVSAPAAVVPTTLRPRQLVPPGILEAPGTLAGAGDLGGSFTGAVRKPSQPEPTETQGSEPEPTSETHGIEPAKPTLTSGSDPKPTETHIDEPEPTMTHGSEPEMPSETGSPSAGSGSQPGGVSQCDPGTITCCNSVQADGSMGGHGSYDIPLLGGVFGGGSASGSLDSKCDGVNSSSRAD